MPVQPAVELGIRRRIISTYRIPITTMLLVSGGKTDLGTGSQHYPPPPFDPLTPSPWVWHYSYKPLLDPKLSDVELLLGDGEH